MSLSFLLENPYKNGRKESKNWRNERGLKWRNYWKRRKKEKGHAGRQLPILTQHRKWVLPFYAKLWVIVSVWIRRLCFCICICVFLFSLFSRVFYFLRQITLFITVHTLFMGPIAILFRKIITNRSYGTIHTFKNYFVTVFSVFSFSKNKLYPNGPIDTNIWNQTSFILSEWKNRVWIMSYEWWIMKNEW